MQQHAFLLQYTQQYVGKGSGMCKMFQLYESFGGLVLFVFCVYHDVGFLCTYVADQQFFVHMYFSKFGPKGNR